MVFLDGVMLEINYEHSPPSEQQQEDPPPQQADNEQNPDEQSLFEELFSQENEIQFVNPKIFFNDDEEPEFILPKIEIQNLTDKISAFLQSKIQIEEASLINPENNQLPADLNITEGETNKVSIKKPTSFQPGKYYFKIRFKIGLNFYNARTEFDWGKKEMSSPPPPAKKLFLSLAGQPIKIKRFPAWYPEKFEPKDNTIINISLTNNKEKAEIIFSGTCQKAYYVILMYGAPDDYEKNPSAFNYNKAFPCQNGSYQYKLNDLPETLAPGVYYFLIAEQNSVGPWQPITAIQPVRLEIKEVLPEL